MAVMIRLLLLLMAMACTAPSTAHAAEVAYPPGSRIGLAPPSGMVTSRNFFGFEDASNNVAIILAALPGEAYADLDRTITADALKRQGVMLETREEMPLAIGKAFLVIGRQELEKTKIRKWILVASSPMLTALVTVQIPEAAKAVYPDASVRSALASLAIRSEVPVDEQLGLLPFTVAELAGFKVAGVIPGRALMLSDAAPSSPPGRIDTHMFVTVAPGGPGQASERDAFARDVLATVPNLKEIHVTTSEPLRIVGQQGHQIMANARDAAAGAPLALVQWLRFGSGGYMQMIGITGAEGWKDAYPRFRSVRDGVDLR
jgi:hypothetical protein